MDPLGHLGGICHDGLPSNVFVTLNKLHSRTHGVRHSLRAII